MDKPRLLIADDEYNTREALVRFFKRTGNVTPAPDGSEAIRLLQENDYDLVLTDLRMPGADGMEVLAAANSKKIPTVVLTAYGSISDAVKAVKQGAYDFVSKPIKLDALAQVVDAALDKSAANRNLPVQKSASATEVTANGVKVLISDDADPMKKIYETALTVAPSRATVLLRGESGTGKEVIARTIHEQSRRTGEFVAVHCAALTSTILESELFGHEKGAFTGASERRAGKFEQADKGTVFLDEVGEIDAATQVKLLRVLETRTFERVGGIEPIKSDFRLIAATNRDLQQMVAEGTFREDLYYRLSVIDLELPPLRQRRMVIPGLLKHFAEMFAGENGIATPEFTPAAMNVLQNAAWSGNIRQLRNCVESMVVLSRNGVLDVSDIPENVLALPSSAKESSAPSFDIHVSEWELIEKALAECNGNRTRAAEKLGISRRTLLRRLAEKK